jgi:hypothetical protein
MKDAPRLSGFTAPESARADFAGKPAESWRCRRQAPLRPVQACAGRPGAAGLSPTGGRAGRFAAAVRGGPWTGLLQGRLTFHALWIARGAVEQLK